MAARESLAARGEAMLIRVTQSRADEADQQARTAIETARTRAARSVAALRDAKVAVPALAACGYDVSTAVPGALLPEVARARSALRAAATHMVGHAPEDVAARAQSQSADTALTTAEKLARVVLANLNGSVEQGRRQRLPEGIDDQIAPYPGVSDVLIVRLKRLQSRLQRKVENLPAGELAPRAREIIDDAAAWAVERPQLEASLKDRHPDVREFVRQAATEEGAPWRLITPTVSDWLGDPDNAADLRVVLRS